MAANIIHGTGLARITLRDAAGTATFRFTLQSAKREGLDLQFQPEGTEHRYGSGGYYGKDWVSKGVRPALEIVWDHAFISVQETWSGAAWITPTAVSSALAAATILQSAMLYPCLVEPHADHAFSFEAQPDLRPLELQTTKGVCHTNLKMRLIGQVVVAEPTWLDTPTGGKLPAYSNSPSLLLHVNKASRVTLFNAAGTKTYRWTLQDPDKEARILAFTPEGTVTIASDASRTRILNFQGWRLSLKTKWASVHQAYRETWSGSAWGAITQRPMAQAAADILWACQDHLARVEPFGGGSDDTFGAFTARTFGNPLSLRTLKGTVHRNLELVFEQAELQGLILSHELFGVPDTTVEITSPAYSIYPDGLAITYTALASCPDPYNGPYTYAWAFDGGGTGTGASVSKTWPAPGTYLATVTATNLSTGGTATASVTIRTAADIGAMAYAKYRTRAIYVAAKAKAYILFGEGPSASAQLSVLTVADGSATVSTLAVLSVAGGHNTRSCWSGLGPKMAILHASRYIVAMGSDSGASNYSSITKIDTDSDTITAHTQYVGTGLGVSCSLQNYGSYVAAGPGTSAGSGYFVLFAPSGATSVAPGNRSHGVYGLTSGISIIVTDGFLGSPSGTETGDPGQVLPQPPALETDPWVEESPHTSYSGVTDMSYGTYSEGLYVEASNVFLDGVDVTPPAHQARLDHGCVYLGDHKWLLVGGRTGAASTALNSGDVYDSVANTFTAVSNTMTKKRFGIGGACCMVGNGNVLIVGGNDETDTTLSSVEVYNVERNAFVSYN